MSMAARRIRRAFASQGPSYDDFLEHIESISELTEPGSGTLLGALPQQNTVFIAYEFNKSGDMAGSPWGNPATASNRRGKVARHFSSSINRVVQHSLPSEAAFDQQILRGGMVLLDARYLGGSTTPEAETDRNGYTSVRLTLSTAGWRVVSLVFWDFAQRKAFEMNPYENIGPLPYEW